MKFTEYNIKARLSPTIVTALMPVLVFNHFYASEEFQKLVGYIFGIKLISALSVSGISLLFLAEFSRAIGKQFFQILIFQDELRLPTTQFMLYADATYSNDFKNRFRDRIRKEFKITLPSIKDETRSEDETRKRIAEAITSVRKKLDNNGFLLKHNIEYGAIRNSLGGAILAAFLCALNIFLFYRIVPNAFAMNISIALIVIYCGWVTLGFWLVRIYGRSYAKILFREYMK